jgi:hypothetical protein
MDLGVKPSPATIRYGHQLWLNLSAIRVCLAVERHAWSHSSRPVTTKMHVPSSSNGGRTSAFLLLSFRSSLMVPTSRLPVQPTNQVVHGVYLASSPPCMFITPISFHAPSLNSNQHSTLSISILYVVFGVLYNRYVLRLRGFDQIPQFSIASMKYHAHEVLDWLKDVATGMHEGGRTIGAHSGFFSSSSSASELGLGGGSGFSHPNVNPVSHQNQNQNQNHGREGGTRNGSSSGFVRPQSGTGLGPENGRRGEINPVSHQAQSRMESRDSLASQPPRAKKENLPPRPLQLETGASSMEDREFMLGDDEGDDVGDAPSKPSTVDVTLQPPSLAGITTSGHVGSNSTVPRGRDLGGGDVTRL